MENRMTVKEAAPFLKISEWLLYDMVRKKQIPHFKIRSKIFFRREALEAWMLEQEAASALPAVMPFGKADEPRYGSH
jgi:excisionase family DNA binding protein